MRTDCQWRPRMDEIEQLKEFRAHLRVPDADGLRAGRAAVEAAIHEERSNQAPGGARKPRMRPRVRWVLAGAAAAAALGIAAALLVLPSADNGGGQANSTPLGSLLGGGAPDYDPVDSPAQLARELENGATVGGLIVKGTIQGFAGGRIYGEPAD